MSLSQKFSGMVLVPWFNRAEWLKISEKIYSNEIESQLEALANLKIWKLRTPILPAGIEGSIIILEALLSPKENLNDTQIAQIYSISLLRFLNVCATNNEKQGTFYTTAIQNGLPKWLISLRHDIAHDHKLPSKYVLELGLIECLQWLKVKYWEEQNKYISNFVKDNVDRKEGVIELLETYIEVTYNFWNDINIDKVLKTRVLQLIHEDSDKIDWNNKDWALKKIFDKLKQLLVQIGYNSEIKDFISEFVVCKCLLIQDNDLNSINTNNLETQITMKKQIFKNLLNLLLETGFIFNIIEKLYTFSLNNINEEKFKKFACLWIYEILLALIKVKNNQSNLIVKDSEDDIFVDCLQFYDTRNCEKEGEIFQKKIIQQPSEYSLIFLEVLMKFNNYDSNAVQVSTNLVKKYLNPCCTIENEKMCTVADLESLINSNTCITTEQSIEKVNLNNVNRWKLITDTMEYKKCALGVLPTQIPGSNLNSFIF